MLPENILNQLKDVHAIEAPGLWPLAWGWWLVITISIMSLIGISLYYISYRRNAYKRQALGLLKEVTLDDRNNAAEEISYLLKRIALSIDANKNVAALNQNDWLEYLLDQCPKLKKPEVLKELVINRYSKNIQYTSTELIECANDWILQHKRPKHV